MHYTRAKNPLPNQKKIRERSIARLFPLLRLYLIVTLITLIGCSTSIVKNSPTATNSLSIPTDTKVLSSLEKKKHQQIISALSENSLDKAKILLKDFIRKRPDLAGPQANLGLIYYKKEQIEKAHETAEKALQLNPKSPEIHNLLGLIENKRNNFKAAETHYTNAIKYKHDYINAHYNLALLYDIYFQEIEKAITHYKRYLELINFKDQQTVDWLEQLENSLKG